jgi:hypothetical protein
MSYIKNYFNPLISVPTLINGILVYHNPLLGIVATAVTIIGVIYLLRVRNHLTFIHIFLQFFMWSSIGYLAAYYEMYKFHTFYTKIQKKNINLTGIITD